MTHESCDRISCYTSFTYSYLSRAKILAATLRNAHPDWELWALLVDEPPNGVDESDALSDFDFIMKASDLGIPRFRSWLFKHDVVEACTAVKGRMMTYLLSSGADKVIYFDPDIGILNPITDIVAKLGEYSVILTPHQVAPNTTDMAIRDNEITALLYGVFNLGFVAVYTISMDVHLPIGGTHNFTEHAMTTFRTAFLLIRNIAISCPRCSIGFWWNVIQDVT